MPYLDGGEGYITKCDRCGIIEDTKNETLRITMDYWEQIIFKGRGKPKLGVFCYECTKSITPIVHRLRDIDELNIFINKLERAINEIRKQRVKDDRAASSHAC